MTLSKTDDFFQQMICIEKKITNIANIKPVHIHLRGERGCKREMCTRIFLYKKTITSKVRDLTDDRRETKTLMFC